MAIAPISIEPGELWVHIGPTVEGFFPEHAHKRMGSEWEAKKEAEERGIAVVMEKRMSSSSLRSAMKGDGTPPVWDVPNDVMLYADIVTTGFFHGKGLVIGCLKTRNGPMFEAFMFDLTKGQQTYWDYLLSEP